MNILIFNIIDLIKCVKMDGIGMLFMPTVLIGLFLGILIIGAFFLWLALKLLDIPPERMTFGSVIVTQLINAIVGLIPCIGCIIQWYIIKVRHTDSWGKAIVAWFLAALIPAAIILGILFAVGALATI